MDDAPTQKLLRIVYSHDTLPYSLADSLRGHPWPDKFVPNSSETMIISSLSRLRALFLASLVLIIPVTAWAISGRVVDAVTKAPIAEAMVTVADRVSRTDTAGLYHLDGPAPEGKVAARAIGYGRGWVAASGSTAPDLELTAIRPKALYLSFWGVGSRVLRHAAMELANRTEINALVIDVKGDHATIPYPTRVALAREIGANRVITVKEMPEQLVAFKAQGLYLIARIVVFKDDLLAAARPEWAVTMNGGVFKDREGLAWVDPSQQEVWEYNLAIAAEAAAMGFDEIQFDYVRFPDRRGVRFGVANNEENRVKAISGFLAAARERLLPFNVFVAADLFGYVAWNENDTDIGQTLDATAPHLDYLCPMLYPSGFQFGIPGYLNPVKNCYHIVNLTLRQAKNRTQISPQRFRPWLQSFRDYAFDHRPFGAEEIGQQIKGAEDAQSNGWMLWNPRNAYSAAGLKPK